MTSNKSQLDNIRALITSDIKAIAEQPLPFDTSTATKLVNYGKFEIAIQNHAVELDKADRENLLYKEEYEKLAKQAQSILESEPEQDNE